MSDRPVSWFVIERGWTVAAADGTEVGKVYETVGDENADIFDGLAFSAGTLGRRVYVPAEQVGEIAQGHIRLLIGQDDVAKLDAYAEPPPSREILAEGSSLWERITGWFRGPRA